MSNVVGLYPVHPIRPEINGVSFSDMHSLSIEKQNELAARGLVFLTDFGWNGKRYGGDIIARSLEHAQEIADSRGFGEEVIGTLSEVNYY